MNSEATEIYHPSPATAMSDETKTDPPPSSVDSTIWMLSQQLQPKQDLARSVSFVASTEAARKHIIFAKTDFI